MSFLAQTRLLTPLLFSHLLYGPPLFPDSPPPSPTPRPSPRDNHHLWQALQCVRHHTWGLTPAPLEPQEVEILIPTLQMRN